MDTPKSTLRYFVSEKYPFLVVSFAGTLLKRDLTEMEKCTNTIFDSTAHLYFLCFPDLEAMDIPGARALARLQMGIRLKHGVVRLCGLNSDFRDLLESQGALRSKDFVST